MILRKALRWLLPLGLLVAGCKSVETSVTPATQTAQIQVALPADPGTLRPVPCRFILPEDIQEGVDVECSDLYVLEQRSDDLAGELARVIRLAVAVFHPPGGAVKQDPVIFLAGGPGASALELIRYQLDALTEPAFATGRDLVVFDQRGVGLSKPALDCPAYDDLAVELIDREIDGRAVSDKEAAGLFLETLRTCRDGLSAIADLSAYHSAASADDVEDLRLASGYEQVNLWGGSYGTRLGLEVMRRHPEGLRSVVLDAVYPPDVDLYVETPANFERALTGLFETCAANDVCASAHPELRAQFFETVARLNADPVLLETEDPFTDELRRTWLNGNAVLALTFQLLYDSHLRYLLPEQFEAAARGDYRAFELAITSLVRIANISSRGMMLSVQCREEIAFSSLEAFQEEVARHPDVAGIYSNSLIGEMVYAVCEEWGAGRAEPSANEPVVSDVPTLVMTGEFDPITPPAWGRRAAATLANSFFYEYPGVGHGASGLPGCPREMFVAFLEDPRAAPGDGCIEGMR